MSTLRATGEKVILVDTPGLDDSNGNDDETLASIYEQIKALQNILSVIIVLRKGDPMSESLK